MQTINGMSSSQSGFIVDQLSSSSSNVEDFVHEIDYLGIIDLLFSAAGGPPRPDMPMDRLLDFINNAEIQEEPLIFLETFLSNYKMLIWKYFQINDHQNLRDTRIIQKFIEVLKVFRNINWDSFRFLAIVTAIVIMTLLLEMEKMGIQLDGLQNDLIWSGCLKKVWIQSNRDVDERVREEVYVALTHWAKLYKEQVFNTKECLFLVYLPRSMREVPELVPVAYKCLEEVMNESSGINIEKQQRLLDNIKRDLVSHIRHEDKTVSIISIKVLIFAEKHLSLNLSNKDINSIVLHCYESRRDVSLLAAEFVFRYRFCQCLSNKQKMIRELVALHEDCSLKFPKYLIDSFYHLMEPHLKWMDWCEYLYGCEADTIPVTINTFYHWVEKSVTGMVPVKRIGKSLEMEKRRNNIDTFTLYFKEDWAALINLDKIKHQKNAVIDLLSVVKFFSTNISFEELNSICEVLKSFLQTKTSTLQNFDVINTVCEVLSSLMNSFRNFPEYVDCIRKHYYKVIETLFPSFQDYFDASNFSSDLVVIQMIALSKHLRFSDENLWDYLFSILSEPGRFQSIRNAGKVKILEILFNLFLNKVKCFHSGVEFDEGNDLQVCIKRNNSLLPYTRNFLSYPEECKAVKFMAFRILCEQIRYFGPHMEFHKEERFKPFAGYCNGDDIDLIIFYAVKHLQCQCSGKIKEFKQLYFLEYPSDVCCNILHEVCSLFSNGELGPVKHFVKLLQSRNRTDIHNNIIIETIYSFVESFPSRINGLTNVIFLGFALNFREDLMRQIPESVRITNAKTYFKNLFGQERTNLKEEHIQLLQRLLQMIVDEALKPGGHDYILFTLEVVCSWSKHCREYIKTYLMNHPDRTQDQTDTLFTTIFNSL